jgi:hypothetical protein
MELKEIAAVSGKSGLFKVLKQARTGVVLESLDGTGSKIVTGPNHRVSLLHEISIYTTDFDKTIPLQEIFSKIHAEFGADPGIDGKADPEELKAFIGHIAPDYDKERVYVSDMKKLVSWYLILYKVAPEVLTEKTEEPKEEKKPEEKAPAKEAKKPKAKTKLAKEGKKE